MKINTFHFVVALGFFASGAFTGIGQDLSLSSPIIIRLTEIDRHNIGVIPRAKVMDGAWLGLAIHGMKQVEIDALVKDGVSLQRSVWVMDGQKIIAECKLAGEFSVSTNGVQTEYGFLLDFDSVEKARSVSGMLSLGPDVDELFRSRKAELDDQRFWE